MVRRTAARWADRAYAAAAIRRLRRSARAHALREKKGCSMTPHLCQHTKTPDAGCRREAPFQGPGAVEIEAKRAERLKDVQRDAPRYLNTLRRAYAGKSLRAAVNAFCIECVGFDAAEVKRCTAPACPLYAQRPGRR